MNRDDWAPGPWDDEPDRLQWDHASLRCRLLRNDLGVWCGYVRLPPDHEPECEEYFPEYDVHGGVTFYAQDQDHGRWWLGFDCGHFQDYLPGVEAVLRKRQPFMPPLQEASAYKTLAFAKAETERLAEQVQV